MNNKNKEIRDLIKNLISDSDYKEVNKVHDDNNWEGLGVLIKGDGNNVHDPLHEELWEGDIEIKLICREGRYIQESNSYEKHYDLMVNEDDIKDFKYGRYLYKILKEKYNLKKRDNKKEKISRIIQKLEK
jgi:hypothetical protein